MSQAEGFHSEFDEFALAFGRLYPLGHNGVEELGLVSLEFFAIDIKHFINFNLLYSVKNIK